jgi:adenosylhomocysteine nucleosidase
MGAERNIGAFAQNHGTVNVGGNAIGAQYGSQYGGGRWRGTRRADVGILTVLTEELTAVVDVLQDHSAFRAERQPGGWQTFHAKVPADGRALSVVAAQTSGRGPRSAALAFGRLRDAFRPSLILVVGVAGGIRRGLEIGDVVIGDEVIYYDARPETGAGPCRSRPMAPALWHRVNEFFRRYRGDVLLPDGGSVRVFRGPIGSGAEQNADVVDLLRRSNEKTVAVETGAGGVGRAFYEQIDHEDGLRGWLTIRGVSGPADGVKGHDQFAADRAALVTDRLLPLLNLVQPRDDTGAPE